MRCHICGKQMLEITRICPECLKTSGNCTNDIERLQHIDNIISITSGSRNIKKCIRSIMELPAYLEGGGKDAKEKDWKLPAQERKHNNI